MQITISLNTDDGSDLAALAALVASLGGRTVVTAPTPAIVVSTERPHVPTAVPELPDVASEALLRQEANRAAGNPTGPSSAGTGPSVFDSSGLPWDERIHGQSGDGTKPTNADGTWRKRRGVSDETVAIVTAELRAALGNAPTPPAPDVPAITPLPPADTAPVTSAATSAAEAPSPPVAEAPTPPAAAASAGGFATFADFVTAVNKTGMTYAQLNDLSSTGFGVPAFRDMKDYPQHWDMFASMAGVE